MFPELQDILTSFKEAFHSVESDTHNGQTFILWDECDTVAEVMGGKAGVSEKIKLKGCLVGPNFDLKKGIDLSHKDSR